MRVSSDVRAAPARAAVARGTLANGWPLAGWSALAVGVCVVATLAVAGTGELGIRAVLRTTARTSFVLFTAAFVAAGAAHRWPEHATGWLLANRRYFFVSFAVSHLVHLVAILALARLVPTFDPVGTVLGGLGYVFIVAMAATSFDRTAAWLGARRWRRFHAIGMYYLWFIFLASYLPRAFFDSLAYAPFVAVLMAALWLRLTMPRRPSGR
jgi:hypothetical protein